jgi:hypothetical protein
VKTEKTRAETIYTLICSILMLEPPPIIVEPAPLILGLLLRELVLNTLCTGFLLEMMMLWDF